MTNCELWKLVWLNWLWKGERIQILALRPVLTALCGNYEG